MLMPLTHTKIIGSTGRGPRGAREGGLLPSFAGSPSKVWRTKASSPASLGPLLSLARLQTQATQ